MTETPTTAEIPASADVALIQRIIPHRYPFLLIDRVRDIVAGTSAVGIKNVTVNEPHFPGHFPAAPIMPGVLIVEAMAQTSAVMVGLTLDLVDKEPLVYFMSIEEAKFRRMVTPGDVLELHVAVTRRRGDIWKFDSRAMVEGKLVAQASYSAMIDRRGR
ncbi:3-hydroxyacyl-ACP dehydratase FabZ [Rhodobaculum claviforme]|uniref:3-hydroxyacyl-[acyl-carrier-protein] dehydratase FabZ n=1 Tax=Rhodobaculum claviforme TaxID=1549854 RepID=A0A934TM61_9RHOB|nr:3-hydroxyacyl-ACP dehydratase FabZ [Rhodobaculum claviforme]MBK5927573.1 3-hydroxyacyl-[acyl-carrier-protein] dehydratase FabZ [Rhodobaculum claviforme]